MSESSNQNGGESPNSSPNRKYHPNSRSGGESPSSESNYSVSTKSAKNSLPNLDNIKNFLKETEDFIVSKLENEPELKLQFISRFREIVMESEEEILKFPNTSFFIGKFENDNTIKEDLREKVVSVLYEKKNLDQQKKSRLKYW